MRSLYFSESRERTKEKRQKSVTLYLMNVWNIKSDNYMIKISEHFGVLYKHEIGDLISVYQFDNHSSPEKSPK